MYDNIAESVVESLKGIQAEVSSLRDDADNRIGPREIARDMINQFLKDFPVLVKGDYLVSYKDDRGDDQVKLQSKNLALWTVALQTTIEVGYTSYHLLGSTFAAWSLDAVNREWDIKSARKAAKGFISVMQQNQIVKKTVEMREYVDDNGVTAEAKVVYLTEACKDTMFNVSVDMREHTHMVCKPLRNRPMDWVSSVEGVGDRAGLRLITGQKYKGTHVAQPVLDAVNKLQSVKFTVSPIIIDAAYDVLDNQHEENSSVEDIRMYNEIMQYEHGEYHFPITMDTRGRMYYRGGLLSPQGTDFCKAAFQFADAVELGELGLDAICVHLANCLGYSGKSIDDRIGVIQSIVDSQEFYKIDTHYDVIDQWPKADKFQALVAIKELQRLLKFIKNNDRDFNIALCKSSLVCHQDGTCNGLQHMAAITHNRETAIAVNCTAATNDDVPSDIYGLVAENAALDCVEDNTVYDLITKYSRDMAKNPVMITGYGAGEETIIVNLSHYLDKQGENTALSGQVGSAYVKALNNKAGAVRTLTQALKARMKARVAVGQTKYEWYTQDGFRACTEYRDQEVNRVRAGKFNALVRNMFPAPLDDVKTVGAMAPNFIHSIDANHCRNVINECDWDLVTVHDSIGSHAGNFFETGRIIREQFVHVHQYDAIGNLCDNMEVRRPKFRGDYDVAEALEATYLFS